MAGKHRFRTRCTATRKDGRQCEGYAPIGETLCKVHADPDYRKGNSLAAIHGLLAKQILTDQELDVYESMKAACLELLGGSVDGIDEANLDALCHSAAKRTTALQVGHALYAKEYYGAMNAAAKRLGIQREVRELGNRQGPQNIIQMILNSPAQAQQVQAPQTGRALPMPKCQPVIEAEFADDDENAILTSHNTEKSKTDNE